MDAGAGNEERFAIPFVKALILAPERDRFLLQRRIKAGDPYAGFWELPGGRIRRGETVEAALRREIEEEAGIRLQTVLGQRWGGAAAAGAEPLTDRFGRSARVVRPLVSVEVVSGPWPILGHYFACLTDGVPARTAEGDDHRWITPGEFRRLFLSEPGGEECTTLDLLAMRTLLEAGGLESVLRST